LRTLERKLGLAEAVELSLFPTWAFDGNGLQHLASGTGGRQGSASGLLDWDGRARVRGPFLCVVQQTSDTCRLGLRIYWPDFGWHWGFVAGWTLLLTYLTYAAGVGALIGNFTQIAPDLLAARESFGPSDDEHKDQCRERTHPRDGSSSTPGRRILLDFLTCVLVGCVSRLHRRSTTQCSAQPRWPGSVRR
jgi:hypothetical protein